MGVTRLPINRVMIEDRLRFIERSLESLERFKQMSVDDFGTNPDFFRIAYYDLYTALEAGLDIGAHILSRIPGVKPKSYKDIPALLSEHKILPKRFVEEKFLAMAGYRNRMTHFYHRLIPAEILEIIRTRLADFDEFGRRIRKFLDSPEKFGFRDENGPSSKNPNRR